VWTRAPFNFRRSHKGYTLGRPVRPAQEIRPRKVEKVRQKGGKRKRAEERRKGEEEEPARKRAPTPSQRDVRAKQWRSGEPVRFSEEMNGEQEDKVDEGRRIAWRERGSDREGQRKREKERGANNVSARSVSRSRAREGARGMKDADV